MGELVVHAMIARADPERRRHLVRFIECMYFREHLLLFTELCDCTVLAHYVQLEAQGTRAANYNDVTIRKLSAQLLDALAFMHELGITHCDVKPANVCIANWGARHFKLIDFGSATQHHDLHVDYVETRWYRSPEVILGCLWGPKIDIWAFACMLFEIKAGAPLFAFSSPELILAAQEAVCGPFPAWMLVQHPVVLKYFGPGGRPYEIDPAGMPTGVYELTPSPDSSLQSILYSQLSPAVYGDVAGSISFLETLLMLDPNMRPTAAQAANHPWLGEHRIVHPA